MLEQALRFHSLAPNMTVKIAATEAVERGLDRRQAENKEIDSISPVCTIMVGRLDDWLKVVAEKDNIILDPGFLESAGVAVFKKTYRLFSERGYRVRLLSASFAITCTGAS